jgi:hypothetical protein
MRTCADPDHEEGEDMIAPTVRLEPTVGLGEAVLGQVQSQRRTQRRRKETWEVSQNGDTN